MAVTRRTGPEVQALRFPAIPAVPAVRLGRRLLVTCCYCGRRHTHSPIGGPERDAHCHRGTYRLREEAA